MISRVSGSRGEGRRVRRVRQCVSWRGIVMVALRAFSIDYTFAELSTISEGVAASDSLASDNARSATNRQPTTREAQFVIHPHQRGRRRNLMDDIERDGNEGDDDEQFEQMIVENSILLHSLAALLVRKGLIKQEEIDAEMDKLYDEMEKFDGE